MDLNSIDIRHIPQGMEYGSSKTYTHSQGLSCTFRQWRAKSHCRFLHGYALKVDIKFIAHDLDERNWAVDFGGLKEVKKWLEDTFDHKTLIAKDDPAIEIFRQMSRVGSYRQLFHEPVEIPQLIQLVEVPSVGVEAFSRYIWEYVRGYWLPKQPGGLNERVDVKRVTVSEHEGNSAWYGFESQTVTASPPIITAEHISPEVFRRVEQMIEQKIQLRDQSRRRRTGV